MLNELNKLIKAMSESGASIRFLCSFREDAFYSGHVLAFKLITKEGNFGRGIKLAEETPNGGELELLFESARKTLERLQEKVPA